MEQNNNTNNLYHHGIPGMKWGVRRYQNKDGSLTAAGRKRAAKLENQYNKLTGKKMGNKSDDKSSNKPKRLTNEELKEKTNRLRLENEYARETSNYKALHPQKISKGKAFVNSLKNDVVKPAAKEAGKRVLTNYLEKVGKDLVGLNDKKANSSEELAKRAQDLKNRKTIDDIENYFKNKKK